MKLKELPQVDENILHAVRIEQPNADGRAIRKRYNLLFQHDEKKDYGLSIGVMYNALERLEDKELIRSELRTVKTDEGKEEERHYFHTTDKGKRKDAEYKPADSDVSSGTPEIPIFVPGSR